MATNFEQQTSPTPVKPDRLALRLKVQQVGGVNQYTATFQFEIRDADGNVISARSGDLIPQLTANQKTTLKAFLDSMLTKAQATVP